MASLVNYSYKKQMKIAQTSQVLDLKGWEMIPAPFLRAMMNALKCEMETAKNMSKITETKQKVLEQKKSRTRKVKFGTVEEHSGNKIQEKKIIIQGNLMPETLFKGGKNLKKEVINIMEKFSKKPFIFNLAHGILPGTPIKNVEKLIKLVRN